MKMKQYLFVFSNIYKQFRIPEFTALLDLCNVTGKEVADDSNVDLSSPAIVVNLESDDIVRSVLSRALLIKAAYELWAVGSTYTEINERLKQIQVHYTKYFHPDHSFCIRVQGLGRKRSIKYAVKKIEDLSFLPFSGEVDLKNPRNTFHFVETFDPQPGPSKPHQMTDEDSIEPNKIFFGRLIGKGQTDLPHKYNLQERRYIGNTSMDPQLAFIQANIAKVTKNSLVLDPFVGTGGILLAAAHFEALCVGAEINYTIVHGIGKSSRVTEKYLSENQHVLANFQQYDLLDQCLCIMIADSSRTGFLRAAPIFDAIITDPPYGLREKSRKLGKKNRKPHWTLPSQEHPQHYPEKTKYRLTDVFSDLLNLAATYLRIGGRLAYWFPVISNEYSEDNIPQHPCLRLVENCEQKLCGPHARRLLVMEKISEPSESDCAFVFNDMHERVSFRNSILRNNY